MVPGGQSRADTPAQISTSQDPGTRRHRPTETPSPRTHFGATGAATQQTTGQIMKGATRDPLGGTKTARKPGIRNRTMTMTWTGIYPVGTEAQEVLRQRAATGNQPHIVSRVAKVASLLRGTTTRGLALSLATL